MTTTALLDALKNTRLSEVSSGAHWIEILFCRMTTTTKTESVRGTVSVGGVQWRALDRNTFFVV